MIKRSKFIYIIGSVIIGVIALLIVLFALIASGAINATQTKVVFASASKEFVYDGKTHRSGEWELVDGQLKKGHTAKVTVSGSQTDAGSSENFISAVIVDANGADVTAYYEIEYQTGALTVKPRPVTVSSFSKSKIYDGTPLTYVAEEDRECELSDGELVSGHSLTVVYTGSVTEAGKAYNTFTPHIFDGRGREKTANYAVTCDNGVLEVIKRPITFVSEDAEKEYDGTPLTRPAYKMSVDGLAEGHTEEVIFSGTRTGAGKTDNEFTVKILAGGREVTHNYEINSEFGELTVTPYEITVTTAPDTKQYDGTPLTNNNYELSRGVLEELGHSIEITVTGSQTDAGSSGNTYEYKITAADGSSAADNYKIIPDCGELVVTKIQLTVTSAGGEKTYDGEELTADGYEITEGGLLEGHGETVKVFGSQTNAGDGRNDFTVEISDADGNPVTENYAVKKVYGILRVKPKTIVIETKSSYWEYDGTSHSYPEWEMPEIDIAVFAGEDGAEPVTVKNELLDGHEIDVDFIKMLAKQTDVGTCDNGISDIVINFNGDDVTENYDIRIITGKLYVTPRAITFRSGDAQKFYDGEPLVCNEKESVADVYGKLLVGEPFYHDYEIKITGSRTEVGESENTIEYVIIYDGDGNDISYNYEITKSNGVLFVLPETPAAKGGNNLKDNGSLSVSNANDELAVTVLSEKAGKIYLRYTSYGGYTGAGWEAASPYAEKFDGVHGANYLTSVALHNAGYKSYKLKIDVNSGDYLLPYYTDTYDCLYEVQTTDSAQTGSTEYAYFCYYYPYDYEKDGAIYVENPYAVYEADYADFVRRNYLTVDIETAVFMKGIIEEQGFKSGDGDIVKKVADYIRNAAYYTPKYNKALDKAENVVISFLGKYGQGVSRHFASAATLLFRTLEIPARYVTGYKCTAEAGREVRLTGNNAHAWVEVYIERMGWVKVDVTPEANENDGKNVVKPRNEYYPYDGVTHRHSNVLQGLSPFIESGYTEKNGYKFEISVSGSRSTAGKTECVIEKFVLKLNGEDVTDKFISDNNIVFETGVMQVYLSELTVTTENKQDTVYDGTHIKSEIPPEFTGSILQGHRLVKLVHTGVQQNVGMSNNTYDIKIVDDKNNDVTDMYKITSVYGALRVTARPVTITANSKEVDFYDSPVAEDNGYTVDEGGLAQGHTAKVTVSGRQTGPGESENKITSVRIYDQYGNDVTSNYKITTVNGWLKVNI